VSGGGRKKKEGGGAHANSHKGDQVFPIRKGGKGGKKENRGNRKKKKITLKIWLTWRSKKGTEHAFCWEKKGKEGQRK